MSHSNDDARAARRARLRELIAHTSAEHAVTADAVRARLAALADEQPAPVAPATPQPPPDDALARIRASLERSHAELAAIRADIEKTAAAREAAPIPAPREPATAVTTVATPRAEKP